MTVIFAQLNHVLLFRAENKIKTDIRLTGMLDTMTKEITAFLCLLRRKLQAKNLAGTHTCLEKKVRTELDKKWAVWLKGFTTANQINLLLGIVDK